jgi:hypothetical protein
VGVSSWPGIFFRVSVGSGVGEQVVVVGEPRLHAGLRDGEQDDEAAFFGCGPDGLGWGEVAELRGAYGAGETGRLG